MQSSIPETRDCQIISRPAPVAYADALDLQRALVGRRQAGGISDTLLLLEHAPTITLGRAASDLDLHTDRVALAARGITVEHVDRGGEITYHAPGQLVGYPILDLRRHGQDLHRYLRDLEDMLIRVLAGIGLTGVRIPGLTGVWVDGSKVAAIGIKVSRWVTMHGFALNIDLDMAPMREDFIPCGIRDRGVTSIAELLPGSCYTRSQIEPAVVNAFCDVFGLEPTF